MKAFFTITGIVGTGATVTCVPLTSLLEFRQDGVEIHVQKVRNKMAGTLGMITLGYKRNNGTYFDNPEELAMQRKANANAYANAASGQSGGGSPGAAR